MFGGPGGLRAGRARLPGSSLGSLLVLRRPRRGNRLAALVHVLLREEARAQDDLLLHLLAREDPEGDLDGLRPAGRVLEGRVEDALPDVAQPLVRRGRRCPTNRISFSRPAARAAR